ncbi:effector-associated constant component EACC1 [Streptomyces sp. KR80]|uniref:effector-associated constant component EACC1 n=1 Tax=Streptomyces sp. KR80 TaxID=3457426 RepID=UPI003FD0412E
MATHRGSTRRGRASRSGGNNGTNGAKALAAGVDIRIGVEGSPEPGKELQGIAGWLKDEESFTRNWTFTHEPVPGRAGAVEDLVVALTAQLTASALDAPVRALVDALMGWLRSRVRLSRGNRTVVVVRVPGREPVRITEQHLTADHIPEIVRRVTDELEAGTSGGA